MHNRSLILTPAPSLHLPSPISFSQSGFLFFLPFCPIAFFLLLLSLPSSYRQPLLTAEAPICSMFAANRPLVCHVQGNKLNQAGAQAQRRPIGTVCYGLVSSADSETVVMLLSPNKARCSSLTLVMC